MISSSIIERELKGGGRMLVAPMKVRDVVAVEGSVYGGWNMLPEKDSEVPVLAAELLDAGTKSRSKAQIRGKLAALGATLSFTPGGDRMQFSASCFPEDMATVLGIAFDCLANASFPASEIEAARKRVLGDLAESKTDTREQAKTALLRSIYDAGHPNCADDTATRIKKVKSVTRAKLKAYGSMLGRGGLVLALTGYIDADTAARAAEKAASVLGKGTAGPSVQRRNGKRHKQGEERIPIPDKANIDVFLGASVPFTSGSKEIVAFSALSSLLGGRGLSTGHLMRTIRERDGFTYGIYAMPGGFEDGLDGYFLIWATFSPQNYQKALTATRTEIATFLVNGITEDALSRKKTEMIGRFMLSLSTTRGRALALLSVLTEGKAVSYLDEYPSLVEALSVGDLRAVAEAVPLMSLSVAASGTFDK